MATEQDIEKLESLVKHIEDYVSKGVWEANQHEDTLAAMVQSEAIYNQIIAGYVDRPDIPPVQQAYQVSDLQERLHRAKHNLPFPPVKLAEQSKSIVGRKVVIYTAPT